MYSCSFFHTGSSERHWIWFLHVSKDKGRVSNDTGYVPKGMRHVSKDMVHVSKGHVSKDMSEERSTFFLEK